MSRIRPTVLAKPLFLTPSAKYVPLWKRLMEYPKFSPGDPQVKLYLPNYWMCMQPGSGIIPPGVVKFEVHPQMTASDVKQMLVGLYNVKPLHVTTRRVGPAPYLPNLPGYMQSNKIDTHRKLAYVFLQPGEHFEFPDIIPKVDKEKNKIMSMQKNLEKQVNEKFSSIPGRPGLPQYLLNSSFEK